MRSTPIGAVLIDGRGTVVARGRNRRNDRDAPDGQLRGSNLAHAEINALTALTRTGVDQLREMSLDQAIYALRGDLS